MLVALILVGVALVAAIAALVWTVLTLTAAEATIREQDLQLEEQRELIDEKQVFGAAMEGLLDDVAGMEGAPFAALVPWDEYDVMAARGWAHRWDLQALRRDTAAVSTAAEELAAVRAAADAEAAGNATGSTHESVLDALGGGYVRTVIEDADTLCADDVLACVMSDDPYVVHVDAADDSQPYTTDWLRTGLAYHEFAHVLQFTNPEPTATAVEAFGGDLETMADCYALTFLDGWTLDHTVWVSRYEYWEVSVGYGYTCDEAQRQVVRDWHAQLGVVLRTVGG